MDYKPDLPKGNVNVSHEKPFREFFALFFGIIVFLFVAYEILGFTIDISINHLSPKWEKKLFSSLGDSMFEEYESDGKLQELVNGLSKCANLPYNLKVKVKQSPDSNAFAFPGGQIVVYSHLIDKSKSQNGLAFVLAHEIGHFKNRDHLRMLGKSMLFSLLVSTITTVDLDSALSPLANMAQMKYSQSHESQADAVGLDVLNCYYGHVGGAMEFFNSISKMEKNPLLVNYFSTHPQTKERIEALKNRIKDKGYEVKKTIPMWR